MDWMCRWSFRMNWLFLVEPILDCSASMFFWIPRVIGWWVWPFYCGLKLFPWFSAAFQNDGSVAHCLLTCRLLSASPLVMRGRQRTSCRREQRLSISRSSRMFPNLWLGPLVQDSFPIGDKRSTQPGRLPKQNAVVTLGWGVFVVTTN